MKRVLIFCLAILILMSFAGCAAPEQVMEFIEPTETTTEPEVTTEPEPTGETLPAFEECRVLPYYLSESPANISVCCFADIEPVRPSAAL